MKISVKILVKMLVTIALLGAGTVIGALLPEEVKVYGVITAAAVAALFFIFIGYNGHKKEENSDEE